MRNNNQHGQALIVVLLVMAVVLTVVVSTVSRSITDITISQKEDEAARAFSAAEAGIERGLLQFQQGSLGIGATITNQGSELGQAMNFSAKVEDIKEAQDKFVVPTPLASGETATIWLASKNPQTGNFECPTIDSCFTSSLLTFLWGDSGTTNSTASTAPALEISIYYNDSSGNTKIARATYDANSSRASSNSFDSSVVTSGCSSIGSQGFEFCKTIQLSGSPMNVPTRSGQTLNPGPLFARLKLLYNTDKNHHIGAKTTNSDYHLPPQGVRVTSTGQAGDAARKVVVYRMFPDTPPIFDFSIFSGQGGLEK